MADRQVDALEVQHRIAEELRQILLSKWFPCPGNTGCQRTLNMEVRDVQILVWCRDHIIRWVVCFMCTLCVVGMTSFALLIWLVISLVPSCCSQYFANIALFENICRDANPEHATWAVNQGWAHARWAEKSFLQATFAISLWQLTSFRACMPVPPQPAHTSSMSY